MRFSELMRLAGLPLREVRGEAEVANVTADSRRCVAGSCFLAVRGSTQDGHEFIPAAVKAGAVAVVCEDAAAVPPGVALAVTDDVRRSVGRIAQAFHGWPARGLTCLGVTGTKGKTTTTYLIREILAAAGHSAGLLGTIHYETGRRSVPAGTTTPDPMGIAEMTAEMVAAGRTHLVMEVSSHALDQGRIAGLDFRVGVFTNLSGDHADYHPTPEHYRGAKLRLFQGLSPDAAAVVNRDDAFGETVARSTRAKVWWYGLSSAADVQARIERIDASGTRFSLVCGGREVPVATPLIGRHNVFNCLAAGGACLALGIDLETIAAAIGRVASVPGRLQRVDVECPFQVFVDYAHTDDALYNALTSMRPLTKGRLIVVFGCGGNRDRTKRPRMAAVAERLADRVVITSDNPRNEEPGAIIDEIAAGLTESGRRKTDIQPDRRSAIALAVEQAQPGDLVLIAGKGHENYQIIGSQRIHFDDVEIATEMMERRRRRQ